MLTDVIGAIIGFIGVSLLSYAGYLVSPELGFAVCGAACLTFSFLLSRANAYAKAQGNKKGQS